MKQYSNTISSLQSTTAQHPKQGNQYPQQENHHNQQFHQLKENEKGLPAANISRIMKRGKSIKVE